MDHTKQPITEWKEQPRFKGGVTLYSLPEVADLMFKAMGWAHPEGHAMNYLFYIKDILGVERGGLHFKLFPKTEVAPDQKEGA